jgi:hypothetical protein
MQTTRLCAVAMVAAFMACAGAPANAVTVNVMLPFESLLMPDGHDWSWSTPSIFGAPLWSDLPIVDINTPTHGLLEVKSALILAA